MHYYFETAPINGRWENLSNGTVVAHDYDTALLAYYDIVKHDFAYDDDDFLDFLGENETRLAWSGTFTVDKIGGDDDGKTLFESDDEDEAKDYYDDLVSQLGIDEMYGYGLAGPDGSDLTY